MTAQIRQLELGMLDRKEDFRRMKGGSQMIRIPALRKGHMKKDLREYLLTRMLSHDDTKNKIPPMRAGKEVTKGEIYASKFVGVMLSANNSSRPNPNLSLLYQHVGAPLLARLGSAFACKFFGVQHGKYMRALKESDGLRPGSRPETWRSDVSEHVKKVIKKYGCEGWDLDADAEGKEGKS